MPKMTESELLALVETEFESAMGAPGGEISQERANAYDFYLSKALGNEIEGQSQVVTSDVADVVDGMMPSLLRIFTVSENLIDFDPVGPEDIEASRQESDYVNHVFFKKNPAFEILYTWFFDALVQKNGIVKAWWDDSEEVTTESYRGLNDAELAELMDDDELEPVEQESREVELDLDEALAQGYAEEVQRTVAERLIEGNGESPPTVTVTVTDIQFKRRVSSGRARVMGVPPEEYRISADSRSVSPDDARMVGQEREVTRSELLEMGFDRALVDSLPAHGHVEDSEEEIARRDKTDDDEIDTNDRSQDTILLKEAYIRVDYDGDGRSELRQVISAGHELLSNEEADRQPFHVISPQPLPHKHFGRAVAEKVKQVQEVTTTLVRQIMDNLYLTNNPKQNVWEEAIGENTLDDLLTRRAGGINRFERPIRDSVSQDIVPFTAGESFPMLEFWDKVKRDRTGVNADSEGLSPEQLKNIQTTVMSQANDLARMKIEAVVRIFAETGVKSLFRHLHELLLKHQDKAEMALLRGQWVQVDPREWRTRRNMTVKIGLGIGNRETNLMHLEAIWQKQREIVESGGMGTLISPQNIYATAAEIVKNANLKSPELFFSDPGDQPFEPPTDPQAQFAQQQIQLQQQQLRNEAESNQLRHQRELARLEQQQHESAAKLAQQQEKIDNELFVKLEEIANALTKMDLEHSGTDVPGSRTEGDGQ